ncbi:hypothetical protein LGM39_26185 [Burkholderia cepacia]|uniref:hypothetical protein n=1 Tax=Burkholderia cepacia TaxID=292 RepID=UPI001CF59A72|nr:hypothetical protein [Burkholderia cepacia]MCA7902864.1 hypothetical protein [Burkholderia cepacia]
MPEIQEQKVSKPVKVYCKLPNGMQYILPDGRRVRLIGMYGDERSPLQVSGLPGRDSFMGFGVTTVDADDWEQIVKDHGKSAAHVNGLIFSAKDERSGGSEAREKEGEKTGLEPYDPQAHPEDKSKDGTASGDAAE